MLAHLTVPEFSALRKVLASGTPEEPVSLVAAKEHLRAGDDEDTLIQSIVLAAREDVEDRTQRSVVETIWDLSLDSFPCWEIRLPRPPVQSITHVKYYATDGTLTTLATSAYTLDAQSEPARLCPAYGTSWPSTREQHNAVVVRYVAGYQGDVPERAVAAIKLIAGDLYENREGQIVGTITTDNPTVERLLNPLRVWRMG